MADRIIQVTLCDVDKAHQVELKAWYNRTHVPEGPRVPGLGGGSCREIFSMKKSS